MNVRRIFICILLTSISDLVLDYIEHLRPDLVLERFISQSPRELLIAPDWGLKNHEFTAKLKKRMLERDSYQGKKYNYFLSEQ